MTNTHAHIPYIPHTPSVQLWVESAVYGSRPSSVVTFRSGQLLLEPWSSFGRNTKNVNIKMPHKSLVNPLFFFFFFFLQKQHEYTFKGLILRHFGQTILFTRCDVVSIEYSKQARTGKVESLNIQKIFDTLDNAIFKGVSTVCANLKLRPEMMAKGVSFCEYRTS